MKQKLVSVAKITALIIIPVVLLCVLVLGTDWNRWGMWNDNLRQWTHPMEKALSRFFSGKGMPLYNFYNYKGVELFDEGYYGLYNPLIWLAWLLSRVIQAETMPIYQLFCCVLGNTAVFLILSELKVPYYKAWICVLAYLFSPTMFSCGNWYYVWMNYWILPLLLYSILKWESSKTITNVTGTSFILLFSILSGNSQYTFMHYLTWGG